MSALPVCQFRVVQSAMEQLIACHHPRVHTANRLIDAQVCQSCRFAEQKVSSPVDHVDVFVPYYRDLELVSQTVDSILWQVGVTPVIHLVNDCSPEDDTPLKQKYADHPQIRWYKTRQNVGPYRIANGLFYHTVSDWIAIVDSDDILLPDHLACSLQCLREQRADVCGSSMQQFLNPTDEHSDRCREILLQYPILVSGERSANLQYPRIINGTMVIRKSVFDALNGFDGDMFCSADTEFIQRLQYPSEAQAKVCTTGRVTALRRIRQMSLSHHDPRYGFDSTAREQNTRRSQERYRLWQQQTQISPAQYGTLSRCRDVFELPWSQPRLTASEFLPVHEMRACKTITACLASIPTRQAALERTIATLLPQVDRMRVHLNGYEIAPSFLNHQKITVTRGDNSRGDATKFYQVETLQGYVFTCDDDLLYPPDYISAMIRGINQYRGLVGASGASLIHDAPLSSFLAGIRNHPLQREILQDVTADIIGTGTLGFHTDDVSLHDLDFVDFNMADLSLFRIARRNRLACKIIQHPDRWITRSTSDHGIYEQTKQDDRLETLKINDILTHYPLPTYASQTRLAVVLLNFKRERNLRRIISQLKKQSCRPLIVVWNNGTGNFSHPEADWIINSNHNRHGHPLPFLYQSLDTEYVCHMDDDLIPRDEHVFQDVIDYMDRLGRSRRIIGGYGTIMENGKTYRQTRHVGSGPHYPPLTADMPVDIVKGRLAFFRQEFADEIVFDHSHVHIDLDISFSLSGPRRLFHLVPQFLEGRLQELSDLYDDRTGQGYCRQNGHYEKRDLLTQNWLHRAR